MYLSRHIERKYYQHGSLAFLSGYTDFSYFGRQQTLCHRDTVLYIDSGHVRVCSLFKIYGYLTGTCV